MKAHKDLYVGSALLFRVLKVKLQEQNPNEKVLDSHVGALMDLDSSSTSNWKKGRHKGPTNILKLRNACLVVGLSLEEAVDILEGKAPEGFEREANLIRARL